MADFDKTIVLYFQLLAAAVKESESISSESDLRQKAVTVSNWKKVLDSGPLIFQAELEAKLNAQIQREDERLSKRAAQLVLDRSRLEAERTTIEEQKQMLAENQRLLRRIDTTLTEMHAEMPHPTVLTPKLVNISSAPASSHPDAATSLVAKMQNQHRKSAKGAELLQDTRIAIDKLAVEMRNTREMIGSLDQTECSSVSQEAIRCIETGASSTALKVRDAFEKIIQTLEESKDKVDAAIADHSSSLASKVQDTLNSDVMTKKVDGLAKVFLQRVEEVRAAASSQQNIPACEPAPQASTARDQDVAFTPPMPKKTNLTGYERQMDIVWDQLRQYNIDDSVIPAKIVLWHMFHVMMNDTRRYNFGKFRAADNANGPFCAYGVAQRGHADPAVADGCCFCKQYGSGLDHCLRMSKKRATGMLVFWRTPLGVRIGPSSKN